MLFNLAAPTLTVFAALTALWGLSVRLRDVSIVDIFWGSGFVLAAASCAAVQRDPWAEWPLLLMVSLWGTRLTVHLFVRARGSGEDHRYTAMRKDVGPSFWLRSLVTVFWLQGVLILLIASPLLSAISAPAAAPRSSALLGVGAGVFLVGFCVEAVADAQLSRFRNRPDTAGTVMNQGLWRYSRHPNYFGDCVLWWGLFLAAVGLGAAWWTAVGPLAITVLLLKVSGVSLMEKTIEERRPRYRQYVRQTSAFVPWPPRET